MDFIENDDKGGKALLLFMFVGGDGVCVCTLLLLHTTHVLLTFSLVDGGGLVGGACVCVALDTQQTDLTTSGTELRALCISAPSFLGCVSAAVSTVTRNRRQPGGGELDTWMHKVKSFDR